MKKLKVKNLAEKYSISVQDTLKELANEGIELKGASCAIPQDMIELVVPHFEELFGTDEEKNEDSTKGSSDSSEKEKVVIKAPVIVKTLAEALGKKPNEIISALMQMGVFASINQSVPDDKVIEVGEKYNIELEIVHREKVAQTHNENEELINEDVVDNPEDLVEKSPVVTFLGHVDHGKTSLQDKIRSTNIVKDESGGITQHIGASTVEFKGKKITFIDTPGHAAFTQMRARGANATDIAILVVAANDGFMPQTVEAMNHALAAKVPIIVAINKIDLPDADPNKVLLNMQQNNLMSEEWGGEVGTVKVSAITGEGMDELLERILLEAELLELKANPIRPGQGVVLESRVEQGLGSSASVLVQNGTLRQGDIMLCGPFYGKVKAMFDDHGKRIKSAGPGVPVRVIGLSGVPEAGAKLQVCKSEKDAKNIAATRAVSAREDHLAQNMGSVEDLFAKLNASQRNDLKVIIKSDVQGSGEAIIDSLNKLPSDKIKVDVILSGVDAITENDVMLAAASNAILIGFHVRVNPGVNDLAEKNNVDIRLYSIIYELIEDITDALSGRLEPDREEKIVGKARILQIFDVRKGPKICGCMVEEGSVKVGMQVRVSRNKQLIFNGLVKSLRRFQDDVKEVKAGLECGIRLDNFMDFVEGDSLEFYVVELKKATL